MKKPINALSTAALAAVFASSTLVPVAVQAAEETITLDSVLVEKDGKIFELSYNLFLDFNADGEDFKIVNVKVGDKTYAVKDFYDALADNDTLTETLQSLTENFDAITVDVDGEVTVSDEGTPSYDEEGTVTEVKSVKAINQTVDKAGTLTFQINNNGKDITAADLPEGYTANFKASANVFVDTPSAESTDGKLANVDAGTKFQFEVEIKDQEGNVVAKSERVTATVQDFAQTVVSIDQVTTTLAPQDKVAQEIKDGKLGLKDEVQLKVEGKVKGNKDLQDFTNGVEPVAKFSVDKPAVLAVDANGKVTAKAKGTATVTITVGDQTEKVTYTVGDERKADKVVLSKDSVSLATGQEEQLTATVTDQYGLGYTGDLTVANAKDDAKVIVDTTGSAMKADEKEAGKYNITLKAAEAAAKGDVAIKSGTTTIATIAVEVKAAKDEIKDYKLVAEDTKFDLKTDTKGETTKKVTLKGYDEQGLEVPTGKQPSLDGTAYELVSKDETVATVENNTTVTLAEGAEAGDKVVIEAVKVTGALKDTVATLEFTVVDSSPTIDDITITSSTSVQTELAVDFTKLATVTASSPEGEVKVAYTVADDNSNKLNIVEANKDGEALEGAKALGTVQFDPTVNVTVDEDGKVVFGNDTAGKTIIASYLVDNTFKGQVELKFETKSFADAEKVKADNKFLAYGLGEDAGKNVVDTSAVKSQTPSDLATVATFLKTQYGATLNTANLTVEDGKATITGPLLSAEDFKKIKGDNPGEYRITMVTTESTQNDKTRVVKIAIKADGTAYFEAIPAK